MSKKSEVRCTRNKVITNNTQQHWTALNTGHILWHTGALLDHWLASDWLPRAEHVRPSLNWPLGVGAGLPINLSQVRVQRLLFQSSAVVASPGEEEGRERYCPLNRVSLNNYYLRVCFRLMGLIRLAGSGQDLRPLVSQFFNCQHCFKLTSITITQAMCS